MGRMRKIFDELDRNKLIKEDTKHRHGQQWSNGQNSDLTFSMTPGLWGQERNILESQNKRLILTGDSAAPVVDYVGIVSRLAEMNECLKERRRKKEEKDMKNRYAQMNDPLRLGPGGDGGQSAVEKVHNERARERVKARVAVKMKARKVTKDLTCATSAGANRLDVTTFDPERKEMYTPRTLLAMTPRTRENSRSERLDYIRPKTPRTMSSYVQDLSKTEAEERVNTHMKNLREEKRVAGIKVTPLTTFNRVSVFKTRRGKIPVTCGILEDVPSRLIQENTKAINSHFHRLNLSTYKWNGDNLPPIGGQIVAQGAK